MHWDSILLWGKYSSSIKGYRRFIFPGKWLNGFQVLKTALFCLSLKVTVTQLVLHTRLMNYELTIHKPEQERKRGADKKPNPHTEHLFKTSKVLEMGITDF